MSIPPTLTQDVLSTVFSYLRPEELGTSALVCRKWGEAASGEFVWEGFDLSKLYPEFNDLRGIWERADLDKYELSVTDAPSLNNRTLIPLMRRMSRFVEGRAGVTVYIKPKGCSLEKLLRIATDKGVPIQYVWGRISPEFRRAPPQKW